jgi:hypothetical protein
VLAVEGLAARASATLNLTKRSIIGGDLNLIQAIQNEDAEKASGFQAFVNDLVWDNRYTQVVIGPTRGKEMLEICLLRPESSFTPRDQ